MPPFFPYTSCLEASRFLFPYEEGTAPALFLLSPPSFHPLLAVSYPFKGTATPKVQVSLNPWLNPAQHGLSCISPQQQK